MLCSQVSFVPGNVARGVFVVLVGRRKGGSPPKVGTPKGSSVMSFVFEIASHTAVTTAQDEGGPTLRCASFRRHKLSASLSACRGCDHFIRSYEVELSAET